MLPLIHRRSEEGCRILLTLPVNGSMHLSRLIHLELPTAVYVQNIEGVVSGSCSEWIPYHFGHSLLDLPIGLGYLSSSSSGESELSVKYTMGKHTVHAFSILAALSQII